MVLLEEILLEKILEIGKDIQGEGFKDLNQEDIKDVLVEDDLTNEKFIAMIVPDDKGGSEKIDNEEVEAIKMGISNIKSILKNAEKVKLKIQMNEPVEDCNNLKLNEKEKVFKKINRLFQILTM